MQRTNAANQLAYKLWAPVYDYFIERRTFRNARARALELVGVEAGERVLMVGVGTGADLPFLPEGVRAVGIDLTPAMLARARRKLPIRGRHIELMVGDAQCLPLANGSFDVVLLTLIVSVVPDAAQCAREAFRVLRGGGRVLVFDKFLGEGRSPSALRRAMNVVTSFFGTDINRTLSDAIGGARFVIAHDEPVAFGGAYRAIVLEKARESTATR